MLKQSSRVGIFALLVFDTVKARRKRTQAQSRSRRQRRQAGLPKTSPRSHSERWTSAQPRSGPNESEPCAVPIVRSASLRPALISAGSTGFAEAAFSVCKNEPGRSRRRLPLRSTHAGVAVLRRRSAIGFPVCVDDRNLARKLVANARALGQRARHVDGIVVALGRSFETRIFLDRQRAMEDVAFNDGGAFQLHPVCADRTLD